MFGFGIKVMGFAAALASFACPAGAESLLSQAVRPLSSAPMSVVKIDKSSPMDLAVIDGGLRRGLRPGVRLSAKSGDGSPAGELIVAEVSADRSVALLVGNADIRPGTEVALNIGR